MEQPVPKGVPTQHGINQRPREINLESQMHWILECARLPGVDVMNGIDSLRHFAEPSTKHCFQIQCMQCSFRFQSRDSSAYSLDTLGELHANRNNHDVLLSLRYGDLQAGQIILPVKKQDIIGRFYESRWFLVWCLLFLTSAVFSTIMSSGILRVVNIFFIGLWGYHLYSWWRNRWKRKRE